MSSYCGTYTQDIRADVTFSFFRNYCYYKASVHAFLGSIAGKIFWQIPFKIRGRALLHFAFCQCSVSALDTKKCGAIFKSNRKFDVKENTKTLRSIGHQLETHCSTFPKKKILQYFLATFDIHIHNSSQTLVVVKFWHHYCNIQFLSSRGSCMLSKPGFQKWKGENL